MGPTLFSVKQCVQHFAKFSSYTIVISRQWMNTVLNAVLKTINMMNNVINSMLNTMSSTLN